MVNDEIYKHAYKYRIKIITNAETQLKCLPTEPSSVCGARHSLPIIFRALVVGFIQLWSQLLA